MAERHESFPWGKMVWVAGSDLQNASTLAIAKMYVRAGAKSERHRHPNCEEAIFVIRGKVECDVNGVTSHHSSGACIVIPAGSSHEVCNIGEQELELLLMYSAGERIYEPC